MTGIFTQTHTEATNVRMGCKSFLFVLLVAVALGFYWNLRGDVSGHVEVLLATQVGTVEPLPRHSTS